MLNQTQMTNSRFFPLLKKYQMFTMDEYLANNFTPIHLNSTTKRISPTLFLKNMLNQHIMTYSFNHCSRLSVFSLLVLPHPTLKNCLDGIKFFAI